jgi:hypothetical protein
MKNPITNSNRKEVVMGATFPIGEPCHYILEERMANSLDVTSFAWKFDTREELETELLRQIRQFHDRFYSAYRKLND